MADRKYIYIRNYSKNGEMAISRHVFEQMAIFAVNHIDGATAYYSKKMKNGFAAPVSPVKCNITKDNKVDINIEVSLKKGVDVRQTCQKIQDEINYSIQLMCELVPVNVTVNVASIEG